MPHFGIAKSQLLCYKCGDIIQIGEEVYYMPSATHKTCGEQLINRKKKNGFEK